jgi:hypothetical protein
MVELLLLEQKSSSSARGYPAASRMRFYSAGGAELLAGVRDQLIAQTVLDQAVSIEEAGEQVKAFIAYVRRLGTADLEATHLPREYRYDVHVRLKK